MLGEMMGGLPKAGEPDLETQWMQTLKKPEIQAAMINFGVELMKPRWTSASALPDALSAGARGYAGVQQEEYNRQQQQEAVARSESEKAADRNTRLETARIGADSRAEVQGLRTAGMLEGIRARNELKGQLTGGFTAEENKAIARFVNNAVKLRTADLTRLGEPVNEKALVAEYEEIAKNKVLADRARNIDRGGERPAIPGDNPSVNPATGGGPVGQPGAVPEAKIPSVNSSSVAPVKPTVQQTIAKLEAAGRWTGSPSQITAWRNLVSDPENFDKLGKASRGSTQDTLRKMYEGQ